MDDPICTLEIVTISPARDAARLDQPKTSRGALFDKYKNYMDNNFNPYSYSEAPCALPLTEFPLFYCVE